MGIHGGSPGTRFAKNEELGQTAPIGGGEGGGYVPMNLEGGFPVVQVGLKDIRAKVVM